VYYTFKIWQRKSFMMTSTISLVRLLQTFFGLGGFLPAMILLIDK
jgi:hypothetical protein